MTITIPFEDALTLGESLERQRLEHRVRRVEQVVVALEQRLRVHAAIVVVPAPLRLAIGDFRLQLRELRRRLALDPA